MDKSIQDKIREILKNEDVATRKGMIFKRISNELDSYFENYDNCLHIKKQCICKYSPETIGDLKGVLNKLSSEDDAISVFNPTMLSAICSYMDTQERERAVDLYNYMM